MGKNNGAKRSNKKTTMLITLNTAFVIFSLGSAITGTYAWFNAQREVETTAGAFSIASEPNLEYTLYYLDHFTDENSQTKPGNENPSTHYYSGYETEYADATFALADSISGSLNIQQLWPAHKLTYAILIEGTGFQNLKIDAWSEQLLTDNIPMAVVQEEGEEETNIRISLAWAINIFGKAYCVTKSTGSNNEINDIAQAYASYMEVAISQNYGSLTPEQKSTKAPDAFNYAPDEAISGETEDNTLVVTPSDAFVATSDDAVVIPDEGDSDRTIVFFTIEFSNDSQTFYEFADSQFIVDANDENDLGHNEFYYSRDIDGNSNCYENLTLASLQFILN